MANRSKNVFYIQFFDPGKAVQGYPIAKVLSARLWIKNTGATLLKRSTFATKIESVSSLDAENSRQRSEPTPFSPMILLFSNSKEGREARQPLRGSASSESNSVTNRSQTSNTPGCMAPPVSWGELQREQYGKNKIRKRDAETDPGKLCFQTALLFYIYIRKR